MGTFKYNSAYFFWKYKLIGSYWKRLNVYLEGILILGLSTAA